MLKKNKGSFFNTRKIEKKRTRKLEKEKLVIVASKSHFNKDTRVDELFERLSYTASKLTIKTLFKLDIQKYAQNSAITSKCSKITKKDGLVSFDSALILDAKFRAYHNWPSIYLDSGLKILSIKINEIRSINKQGVILSIDKNSITIGCEIGSIIIDKIQPKSKKPMGIIDYIRGKRIEVGDILS
jgi:methionyl-tRNA formyltransferase